MRYAVINRKGGVYKTTLSLMLAEDLRDRGRRVLVVDADIDQGSATEWWLGRLDYESGRVYGKDGIDIIWITDAYEFDYAVQKGFEYDDVVFDGRPAGEIAGVLSGVADVVLIPYFGKADKPMAERTAELVRRVNPNAEVHLERLDIPYYESVREDGWSAVDTEYRKLVRERYWERLCG